MDKFGKWGLRVAITVIAVFAVNTCIQLYGQSTPLEREHLWAIGVVALKFAAVGVVCFGAGVLTALAFWVSRAETPAPTTRKAVHHATKE